MGLRRRREHWGFTREIHHLAAEELPAEVIFPENLHSPLVMTKGGLPLLLKCHQIKSLLPRVSVRYLLFSLKRQGGDGVNNQECNLATLQWVWTKGPEASVTDFVIIDSLAARTNKPVDFGTETFLRLASLGKIHITHSHRDASHTQS